MTEVLLCDEARSGIELIRFRGEPGYEDEEISVSNSLSNGLRIEILNENSDWNVFHIRDKKTALLIAQKLIEWSGRIAVPPHPLPGDHP